MHFVRVCVFVRDFVRVSVWAEAFMLGEGLKEGKSGPVGMS